MTAFRQPRYLTIDTPDGIASFSGRLATSGPLSLAGPVTITSPNLRDAAKWAGLGVADGAPVPASSATGSLESAGREGPLVQLGAANPERVVDILVGARSVAHQIAKDKSQHLGEDEIKTLKDEIQDVLKNHEKKIDEAIEAKSKEVLEV